MTWKKRFGRRFSVCFGDLPRVHVVFGISDMPFLLPLGFSDARSLYRKNLEIRLLQISLALALGCAFFDRSLHSHILNVNAKVHPPLPPVFRWPQTKKRLLRHSRVPPIPVAIALSWAV